MRLRNAPTKLMKNLGYGKGYRYAHDEDGCLRGRRDAIFPTTWRRTTFYTPTERGLEAKIREKLEQLRARDRARASDD